MGDVDPEEIEDLINELEDLSDSGPDVDTISVGSTPKPSLRQVITVILSPPARQVHASVMHAGDSAMDVHASARHAQLRMPVP